MSVIHSKTRVSLNENCSGSMLRKESFRFLLAYGFLFLFTMILIFNVRDVLELFESQSKTSYIFHAVPVAIESSTSRRNETSCSLNFSHTMAGWTLLFFLPLIAHEPQLVPSSCEGRHDQERTP